MRHVHTIKATARKLIELKIQQKRLHDELRGAIEEAVESGIKASEIAHFFGVSSAFISDVRKSRRTFGFQSLKRLAMVGKK